MVTGGRVVVICKSDELRVQLDHQLYSYSMPPIFSRYKLDHEGLWILDSKIFWKIGKGIIWARMICLKVRKLNGLHDMALISHICYCKTFEIYPLGCFLRGRVILFRQFGNENFGTFQEILEINRRIRKAVG
jgi:hypothetical protein